MVRTVYGLDLAWRDGPPILMEAKIHPDGTLEVTNVSELEFEFVLPEEDES